MRNVFSGQCRWLQTPTPVLPMIRKSMMWNLPNPMVSTASSTVNVFCPEHQRERKTETKKHVSIELYLLFMKCQHFSCYCGTTPGKRLETSTSCVSTDQPLGTLVVGRVRGLLKQQPAGKRAGWAWGKDSLVPSYPSCFRNPWSGRCLGNVLLSSLAQTAVRLSPSAPLGYGPAPSTGSVSWGLPQVQALQDEHSQGLWAQLHLLSLYS